MPPCGPGPARHRRRPRPRHPSDRGAGSGSPPVPAGRSSRYGPGPARVRPRVRTNGIPDRWSRARAAHRRRRVLGSRAPRVNGAAAAAPVPDPVSPPGFANLPRQVACGQAVPVDLRPFEKKSRPSRQASRPSQHFRIAGVRPLAHGEPAADLLGWIPEVDIAALVPVFLIAGSMYALVDVGQRSAHLPFACVLAFGFGLDHAERRVGDRALAVLLHHLVARTDEAATGPAL